MSNIQYTIRNIPEPVDRVIKKRSKQYGRSFNQTVIDLLSLQTFGTTELPEDDNFDFLFNKILILNYKNSSATRLILFARIHAKSSKNSRPYTCPFS